jgi:hypothetical protein
LIYGWITGITVFLERSPCRAALIQGGIRL